MVVADANDAAALENVAVLYERLVARVALGEVFCKSSTKPGSVLGDVFQLGFLTSVVVVSLVSGMVCARAVQRQRARSGAG